MSDTGEDNVQPNKSSQNESVPELTSNETFDRTSPELWPETVPGISNYADIYSDIKADRPWKFNPEDKEDMKSIEKLSNMTEEEFQAEVKRLQSLAFNLGIAESKEITRAKFLNVFSNKRSTDK